MSIPIIHPPGVSVAAMDAMIEALTPAEFQLVPQNGGNYLIPDTPALIINILLLPDDPLDTFQLILLDGMVAGRRVFIYADKAITQLDVTSAEVGAVVMNGTVSMSPNDLVVFNTVSTANKLWARVATS